MTDDTYRKVQTIEQFIREMVPPEHHPMLDWALAELASCVYEDVLDAREAGERDGRREGARRAWDKAIAIVSAAEQDRQQLHARIPRSH